MQQRILGQQGLSVSAIGYGSMGTVFAYGSSDRDESIAAIRHAHDLGVTHFDTAELYGWGAGEQLLGEALAPFRSEVTIATKFGFTDDGHGGYGLSSRPDHIRHVTENSLRHLQTDTIDLLYQHMPDPEVPIEDVVGTMKELVDEGKVKYLGLSNSDVETIRRGHVVHPISVEQYEYSIFARRDAEALLPTLAELGIGLVAYSPLARGFLSGAVQRREQLEDGDMRARLALWRPENFDTNVAMARALTEVAAGKGITLAQLSLAWLLARRDDLVPIPGSRSRARVAQNVAAAEVTLTEEELALIEAIVPDGGAGGRFY